MVESSSREHSNAQAGLSAKSGQPSSIRDRHGAISKRSRGRTGCLNCRRRRKKCDEAKPVCTKCSSRGEECEWDTGITFRLAGIDAQHPSMLQSKSRKSDSRSNYQIMNVTFEGKKHQSEHAESDAQGSPSVRTSHPCHDSSWQSSDIRHNSEGASPVVENRYRASSVSTSTATFGGHEAVSSGMRTRGPSVSKTNKASSQASIVNEYGLVHGHTSPEFLTSSSGGIPETYLIETDRAPFAGATRSATTSAVDDPAPLDGMIITPGSRHSEAFNSHENDQYQFDLGELEVLDYLTSQSIDFSMFTLTGQQAKSLPGDRDGSSDLITSPFGTDSITAESPDIYNKCYPNDTYKKLHTTLYHHMVETARNTALTRHGTPDQSAQPLSPNANEVSASNVEQVGTELRVGSSSARSLGPMKLDKRRQLELWRNYLDEIALWLDMFDNERHFQFKIPLLAKSADHLHYSILALSARQIERKAADKPYTESLGLYQEAIQLIVKELHTLDTAVIASCVLLCVLEMMSSSPRAWGRHLDGCAMLLEAAGVNGAVGGVRQALFWCFARMDVWGGFLGDTLTKIPTSRWFIPTGSMVDAVSHFKARLGCDMYANYAVFLCASVVNVLSNKTASSVCPDEAESSRNTPFPARWKALFDLLEDWYNNRPEDLQPLMSYPSGGDEYRNPFPVVLYSTSPAINGNQLYHAAALLMLQSKPNSCRLPKAPKSILWHARQICGIATSNCDHGAWINALQPLWIAGKIMSHRSEHQAIVEILVRIERETGWATAWRVQDLTDYWGDPDG